MTARTSGFVVALTLGWASLGAAETRKRIEDFGMEVVASRPEQFDAFIAAEMRRWARVVKEAKIEPE